ncbi:MAG: tetratricopeptide repeat protein, partial [Rhodospirillales bacterium]|nr:tetratricopeptide repeat protein [Rhodospirillales bacterium]
MDLNTALERAIELDAAGDVDAAIRCLDDVSGAVPDTAQHLKFIGQLYQRLGADEKGLAAISRAVELDPGDADLHLSLGFHWIDNSQMDKALACFRKHLELSPDSIQGHLYLGRALDFDGRLEDAEAALCRAAELAPDNAEAALQLGRVLTRQGRYGDALKTFEIADHIDPGNLLAELGTLRAHTLAQGTPPVRASNSAPATIVCVKHGTKYGADYVNRLYSMTQRLSDLSPRLVCFTEDAAGLNPEIDAQQLPGQGLSGWWNKIALFRDNLPGVSGRVLYLDLDVVITANIDPLLKYDGAFVIMDNEYVPTFNSSVMLFEVGARPEIYDDFNETHIGRFGGDQDWIAYKAPDAELWPEFWCVPYRLRAAAAPPADTKVVVFSGRPNPDDYP